VNPTGITLIAFAIQNIAITIVIMQKIVGIIFVNPFVDLRNPLETIPRIIVRSK
tara:strand:- start:1573 stop:1734 length:162 start_codon:yes stop_codon:yes gene_type:complete